MPVVYLKYNPKVIDDKALFSIVAKIPPLVAEALDVPSNPDARLKPQDIEIWTSQVTLHDLNAKDFSVLIFVHAYPERVQNLEERNDKVRNGLDAILRAHNVAITFKGWSWIHPSETAFGRIQPK